MFPYFKTDMLFQVENTREGHSGMAMKELCRSYAFSKCFFLVTRSGSGITQVSEKGAKKQVIIRSPIVGVQRRWQFRISISLDRRLPSPKIDCSDHSNKFRPGFRRSQVQAFLLFGEFLMMEQSALLSASNVAFGLPGGISLPRAKPHHRSSQRTSKRRPRRFQIPQASAEDPSSDKKQKRVQAPEEPFFSFEPLGPTPAEESGFLGWREEDDAYWKDMVEREMFFRSPSAVTEDDLKLAEHPLDRDGNPTKYPAAMYWDEKTQEWVATSAEEEEELRKPNPIKDPYFVPEAEEGEKHTSMRSVPGEYTKERIVDEDIVIRGTPPSDRDSDVKGHRRRRLKWKPNAWKVVNLGTSSAVPTPKRNVSSTAFLANTTGSEPSMFLVDCGENTNSRLIECEWCMTHGFRWIKAIFITHLHGDHIYGLPMLLNTIGHYAQYRRRAAMEAGDDSEPVIRIFGPYGIRGFLRTSLFWTSPVGVKFSVSELVPRDTDFLHIGGFESNSASEMYVGETGSDELFLNTETYEKESPPPHDEEVRAEDIKVGEDGVWHCWEEEDADMRLEVVAAPLKHRLPCFGYVFREYVKKEKVTRAAVNGIGATLNNGSSVNGAHTNGSSPGGSPLNGKVGIEIDMNKARELGVYGSQFRVLRSGRSVIASKTGREVKPEDVLVASASEHEVGQSSESCERLGRKVTILGDTCDSSLIGEAARNSDLLIHEATFTQRLRHKAKVAFHSTAKMAGQFAAKIEVKKLVLTHFSSRFEALLRENEKEATDEELDEAEEEDLENVNIVVYEASTEYEGPIVAAIDFMEHNILRQETTTKNTKSDYAVIEN